MEGLGNKPMGNQIPTTLMTEMPGREALPDAEGATDHACGLKLLKVECGYLLPHTNVLSKLLIGQAISL